NLTRSLRFNFNATNNRIVNNYIDGAGMIDNNIGVWDDFFNTGEPNQHFQTLQVNYDLPTAKFPFLKWIRATYTYGGEYQWQDGSDLFDNIDITLRDGTTNTYNLGNSIQNSSSHAINGTMDMTALYKYLGVKKISSGNRAGRNQNNARGGDKPGSGGRGTESKGGGGRGDRSGSSGSLGNGGASTGTAGGGLQGGGKAGAGNNRPNNRGDRSGGTVQQQRPSGNLSGGDKAANTAIGLLTSLKKIQFNYQENNGIFLPGYQPSIGYFGSSKPTLGFVFGSQREIRELAARNGWLTLYPEFNEQYTEVESRQLDVQAMFEFIPDLILDVNANRVYSENYQENYIVEDEIYRSLTPSTFGNFNITTLLIKTAFSSSDENSSATFDDFRANRIEVADRLATGFYGNTTFERDEDGYPVGFGKTSQDVLLPAFLAAYKGSDVNNEDTGILRDIPLPNWDLKYTGLMKLKWFKKHFKRFSVQHGYRSLYSVSQFQTNLDFNANNPNELDQAGNFKSRVFLNSVNLTEMFSPLLKVDFEMKNSVKILAEFRKDRALSLSFANNLLTEIKGDEIILGLGYRIKDLKIGTNFGGKNRIITSDLNLKLDVSRRDNKTIIRYLDVANNQTTAGQTLYGLQFLADYALSKNLTALFYYDHIFSEYAISTAFPQTTIRTGFTLRYNFGN
ncbi:MAG: cell surface protein SprA, partial [Marinirhabdus sp.]